MDYEQEYRDAEYEEGQERGGMEAVALVDAAAFAVGGAVGAVKQTIEIFDQTIDQSIVLLKRMIQLLRKLGQHYLLQR